MKRGSRARIEFAQSRFAGARSYVRTVARLLLLPLLIATLWLSAAASIGYLLRLSVNKNLAPFSLTTSKIVFPLAYGVSFVLIWLLIGRAAKASPSNSISVIASAKAVTVVALALAGVVALVSGVTRSGGLVVRTLTVGKIELIVACILGTVLAAFAAVVTAYRVVTKKLSADVGEVVFATATAVATLAVAGTVIVLLFAALFFKVLEFAVLGALLGVVIGFLVYVVKAQVMIVLAKMRR